MKSGWSTVDDVRADVHEKCSVFQIYVNKIIFLSLANAHKNFLAS